jgi:signal transduction histidine kinase
MSFVLMVLLSLFSIERFVTYTSYSDKVTHSNKVIANLFKIEVSLKDLDRAERGYILTHDTSYLRFSNNAVDSLRPALVELEQLLAQDHDQNKNISLLKSAVALRVNYSRQDIAFVDSTRSAELSEYYYDGRNAMREAVRKLRDLRKTENTLLSERFANQKIYQKLTTNTLKYLLVIFCTVTLMLFIIMIREFRNRIRYQDELQAKVIDLKRSHDELQEIAYAASHDLQEPLRKIQVFSNMLLVRSKNAAPENSGELIQRISDSAERMQVLITDLMSLTSLTKIDEQKRPVDLNIVLQDIITDINAKILEKNARISLGALPMVNGYSQQLAILFRALLDNALKFTREGIAPEITIEASNKGGDELAEIQPSLAGRKFIMVTCTDNGIGFDDKFISKMFRIFQRLHSQQSHYEGKGIGLAICQRIMVNHEGCIVARGIPMQGAKFMLFFPVES